MSDKFFFSRELKRPVITEWVSCYNRICLHNNVMQESCNRFETCNGAPVSTNGALGSPPRHPGKLPSEISAVMGLWDPCLWGGEEGTTLFLTSRREQP